jgi:hypothetical protein
MPKNVGFNYMAYNSALKLVNSGQLDAAWLILNAMENTVGPDGKPKDNGNFILRHIVRCGMVCLYFLWKFFRFRFLFFVFVLSRWKV